MLSPEDIAKIKAEIEKLEKDLSSCNDSGVRKLITAWINEQKEKLASQK